MDIQTADAVLRKRCGWCRRVLDGLGPIAPRDRCSDGLCKACEAKLNAQMDAYEATK